ncbi:anaerobic carbon-monoxide dehydrogenase catalytic subunit [Desulfofundulus thermosubterraneus]|uniref:Carbon monoxide dehydrogenase n=1 Tax=Desulfofundulus thermosubterraneus DSM 16057 TaxID=1121432 RepID=A0A1M6DNC7_9FIRM|nr:anaerobic carbon-monoxide dehydrogenase catalytic subunit [Desulfofundulus thermosubterraneus]SHI74695.1 Ni-dependent carbon monoxide dehydrogenase precursor [Desulfofundulus thermosubterraneus DSM 16057]
MPRFRDPQLTSRPSDKTPRVIDPKSVRRSVDPAVLEMIDVAQEQGVITAFDRVVAQQPQCQFGYKGICCRICMMGPCRIKAEEGPASRGICGANSWTIVARSVGVMILTGCASHAQHGNHIAHTLEMIAEGKAPDYSIKDPEKLVRICKKVGIETEGKETLTLAKELAETAMEDFRRLKGEGESTWVVKQQIPARVERYRSHMVMPHGIHATISDLVTQAHVGMDNDPVNLVFSAVRVGLADLAGKWIATDLSDIIFGTPQPVVSEANMGVLDPKKVNIVVHGHNPLLSEMIVAAARELEDEARAAGAAGINLAGICCTGNEVLMRQGIPIVTSFSSQELAICTGAVDAMVVDVQCIMPGLNTVAQCFGTRLITTSDIVKIPGSMHIDYQEATAMANAKDVIRQAIEAFKERGTRPVHIPNVKNKVVAGWSLEAIFELFKTVNPDNPVRVLNEAILSGELKGVILMAGCNNLKTFQDQAHLEITKAMLKNDVFVISTGCNAQACAKAGLMDPAKVDEFCGPGLKKFFRRISEKADLKYGLPPVFHIGSCVDNSRAAELLMLMAEDLGVDTPKVPFVASAPEAMSGKATSIGTWAVTIGLPTHVGTMPPVEGSDLIYSILTQIASDVFGGYFILEPDIEVAIQKLLNALEYRTWKLGVHRKVAEDFETALCQNW